MSQSGVEILAERAEIKAERFTPEIFTVKLWRTHYLTMKYFDIY